MTLLEIIGLFMGVSITIAGVVLVQGRFYATALSTEPERVVKLVYGTLCCLIGPAIIAVALLWGGR
ncbi:MAG TPA: hypothetical protein VKG44_07820 [Candidatus Baltobacteraceae bacterium]|nr:hypothetical protein [Candidatus Baltobacteraceae bacterium]